MSSSMAEIESILADRADYHLEQLANHESGANYKYHKYCRNQAITAQKHVRNIIMTLPRDFE